MANSPKLATAADRTILAPNFWRSERRVMNYQPLHLTILNICLTIRRKMLHALEFVHTKKIIAGNFRRKKSEVDHGQ